MDAVGPPLAAAGVPLLGLEVSPVRYHPATALDACRELPRAPHLLVDILLLGPGGSPAMYTIWLWSRDVVDDRLDLHPIRLGEQTPRSRRALRRGRRRGCPVSCFVSVAMLSSGYPSWAGCTSYAHASVRREPPATSEPACSRALGAATPGSTEIVGIARRCPSWQPPRRRGGSPRMSRADDLSALFAGADAVVHLAWLIQPSRDAAELERVNVDGSRRVFEAAVASGRPRAGARVVGGCLLARARNTARSTRRGRATAVELVLLAPQGRGRADAGRVRGASRALVRLRPGLIFKREAGPEIRRLFAGPLLPTGC